MAYAKSTETQAVGHPENACSDVVWFLIRCWRTKRGREMRAVSPPLKSRAEAFALKARRRDSNFVRIWRWELE